MAVMNTAIDFDRVDHGRPDDEPYTREEKRNAIATAGALMVLGVPFSRRGFVYRKLAQISERIKR
ncbi:MAG TPA: hypothetical protein VH643_21180 [Gemmataceae bacterium]